MKKIIILCVPCSTMLFPESSYKPVFYFIYFLIKKKKNVDIKEMEQTKVFLFSSLLCVTPIFYYMLRKNTQELIGENNDLLDNLEMYKNNLESLKEQEENLIDAETNKLRYSLDKKIKGIESDDAIMASFIFFIINFTMVVFVVFAIVSNLQNFESERTSLIIGTIIYFFFLFAIHYFMLNTRENPIKTISGNPMSSNPT